jgi:hypothetical protein
VSHLMRRQLLVCSMKRNLENLQCVGVRIGFNWHGLKKQQNLSKNYKNAALFAVFLFIYL